MRFARRLVTVLVAALTQTIPPVSVPAVSLAHDAALAVGSPCPYGTTPMWPCIGLDQTPRLLAPSDEYG